MQQQVTELLIQGLNLNTHCYEQITFAVLFTMDNSWNQ